MDPGLLGIKSKDKADAQKNPELNKDSTDLAKADQEKVAKSLSNLRALEDSIVKLSAAIKKAKEDSAAAAKAEKLGLQKKMQLIKQSRIQSLKFSS